MRGRFSLLLVCFLAGFAGCGASCKRTPDVAGPDEAGGGVVVELQGIDTSSLVLTEKRLFSKVVTEYMSPCGEPFTLAVCVKENRACGKCVPAAKAVARLVSKGEGEKEIREWVENRFEDKAVKSIDLTGSPSLGPSNAPLVMVEFADFECPHCGMAAPIIHKTLDEPEFKGKTRFVFKNYPLPGHEHADPAARAAVAAQVQGKFFEMHDQLFTHQEQLNPADLEGYAKKIGLDVEKWKIDMGSQETKDKIAKDKEAGQKAGITGTPSVFINGRKFAQIGHGDFAEQLREWMKLDLQLTGANGAPSASAPPAASSAAPAPSASASASASAKASK